MVLHGRIAELHAEIDALKARPPEVSPIPAQIIPSDTKALKESLGKDYDRSK